MTSPRALEQYSAAQWCRRDLGWGYGDALQAVLVASLLGGLWLRLLGRSLAPGAPRLLASLPLLAANAVTSKLFCPGEDATTVVLVCFNTLWLSSFKVRRAAGGLCVAGLPAKPAGRPLLLVPPHSNPVRCRHWPGC